jgi:non-ribosomal peptide synthetase component E (peptide arylation enzyme)
VTVALRVPRERGARERRDGRWLDRFIDGYASEAARLTPSALAVADGPSALTYADADRRVSATAASLQDMGVARGEVVSWQLPNWHEAYVLHQAIVRVGAVSNPIIPIYRQRELTYILSEASSRVFVMPEFFRGFSYADMLADIRPSLPSLEHVVLCRPARAGGFPDFADLAAGDRQPRPVERSPDDPMLLLFTSGTTALPKGAVHTHNTLDYENRSIIDVFGLTGSDIVFMPSPVSHITGLLYGLQLPAMLGTSVVFQDVWDAGVALELIERHRCTFTVAATPFLHGVTYHPRLGSFDVSSLRVFACGGADVPPGLIRDARERLGCIASRIYGSTEFPTLATSGPHDPATKGAATDGRMIGAATCRIVDSDDRIVPPGHVGELIVTGPELFLGYLRTSDNAGAFTADGWFRSGDVAVRDTDGYLTIRGRKKDIVLRGGENISVAEVEDLLFDHPGISEIAIVAMPDPVMVERACAFVVAQGDAPPPTLEDLGRYLGERGVAKQKIPERLELVSELPKTLSGKVQKFRLREIIRDTLARESSLEAR